MPTDGIIAQEFEDKLNIIEYEFASKMRTLIPELKYFVYKEIIDNYGKEIQDSGMSVKNFCSDIRNRQELFLLYDSIGNQFIVQVERFSDIVTLFNRIPTPTLEHLPIFTNFDLVEEAEDLLDAIKITFECNIVNMSKRDHLQITSGIIKLLKSIIKSVENVFPTFMDVIDTLKSGTHPSNYSEWYNYDFEQIKKHLFSSIKTEDKATYLNKIFNSFFKNFNVSYYHFDDILGWDYIIGFITFLHEEINSVNLQLAGQERQIIRQEQHSEQIYWSGSNQDLAHFINTLIDRKYFDSKQKNLDKWVVENFIFNDGPTTEGSFKATRSNVRGQYGRTASSRMTDFTKNITNNPTAEN